MSAIRIVYGKWGGGKHWEFDAVRLGEDRHGVWVGAPEGTPLTRPGAAFTTTYDHVMLVPPGGFVASFYADVPTAPLAVYVDICTPPRWDGAVLRAIDLDLDVVRERDGQVWVDDEGEFAEHRVALGYPDEVAEQALRDCAEVLRAVRAGQPPFDRATPLRWLAALTGTP